MLISSIQKGLDHKQLYSFGIMTSMTCYKRSASVRKSLKCRLYPVFRLFFIQLQADEKLFVTKTAKTKETRRKKKYPQKAKQISQRF